MGLTATERFALRTMGPAARASPSSISYLESWLMKSHQFVRAEVYLSSIYMQTVAVFAGSAMLVVALILGARIGGLGTPAGLLVLSTLLPAVLAAFTYLALMMAPRTKASLRARDIDAKIPYALNYISTVASAGMPPDRLFESLANQPVYGEVAAEAGMISRDMQVLGKDLVTALTEAGERTPSTKMQSFLQGAITALTSGEDLEHYFLTKSEQFAHENRQEEKKFLDTLGVLAESYVTVVVGAPVFLIVLLSMMFVFGGGEPQETIKMGYVLVLGIVPLAQASFAVMIRGMTPEV